MGTAGDTEQPSQSPERAGVLLLNPSRELVARQWLPLPATRPGRWRLSAERDRVPVCPSSSGRPVLRGVVVPAGGGPVQPHHRPAGGLRPGPARAKQAAPELRRRWAPARPREGWAHADPLGRPLPALRGVPASWGGRRTRLPLCPRSSRESQPGPLGALAPESQPPRQHHRADAAAFCNRIGKRRVFAEGRARSGP